MTFLGPTVTDAWVRLDDTPFACRHERGESETEPTLPDAEIAWAVAAGAEWETFAAGCRQAALGDDGQCASGVGDWNVRHRRETVSAHQG